MFAIIDIETTGGNALREKITEIAIIIHDGKKEIDRFSSLINPGKKIPSYISRLTGITDEMVADAPYFHEIAKQIVQFTEGHVFVAHNVNFDYNFIKAEFKSLGYVYKRKTMCTVRLSRQLLPGFPSYSLGLLCEQLGIEVENRHRALGDATATAILFERLMNTDKKKIQETIDHDPNFIKNAHPNITPDIIESLPTEVGVYYLHNEKGEVIYVGKSSNIRKRVVSHLSKGGKTRAVSIQSETADISYELTGSELVALLMEADEIKRLQPLYNRAQRKTTFVAAVYNYINQDGYSCFRIGKTNESIEAIECFVNREGAENFLRRIATKHQLCPRLSGLYDNSSICFAKELGQCKGDCSEFKNTNTYNARVQNALNEINLDDKTMLLIDKGRTYGEKAVIYVEKGQYRGFGYVELEYANSVEALIDCVKSKHHYHDIHRILRSYISRKLVEKVVILNEGDIFN